jgi:hypothetical protein
MHHGEEETFVWLAGHEDWAIVAALEHEPAQAQIDTALQFLALAVTIETMGLEDRADVLFECRGGSTCRNKKEQQKKTETTEKASKAGWKSAIQQIGNLRDASVSHALRKISLTTRQGLVSVMRSSWPLWW